MMAALVAGLALVSSAWAAAPVSNGDCLDCHGQNDLAKTNRDGRVISLFVDAATLKASVHATNLCVACHQDLTAQHPDDQVPAKPPAGMSLARTVSDRTRSEKARIVRRVFMADMIIQLSNLSIHFCVGN